MKKLILIGALLSVRMVLAQNISISDEVYVGDSQGYGIIGKYNDRILMFNLADDVVKLRSLDSKMHQSWERELEPERKNHARVLEVVGSRQDFNMVYQFAKKNQHYIKIHKYDTQGKLLDSVSVYRWDKDILTPNLQVQLSEDRKSLLVYQTVDNKEFKAIAINLDSMQLIWEKTLSVDKWNLQHDQFEQIVFTNHADLFLIQELENYNSEKHRFLVKTFGQGNPERSFNLPMPKMTCNHIKFSFDNLNQKLVAAGAYSNKNQSRSQGIFTFEIPPQYQDGQTLDIRLQEFDTEFVTTLMGKKVSENKGLHDLEVQELIHRRDGGFLVIVEQVKAVERRSVSPVNRVTQRFGFSNSLSMDYYHDNVFVLSFSSAGELQWRSIFFKKQVSQDDNGSYSSFFVAKTSAALRFLFNDQIERSTIVSEYILNGKGESERHAVMNTDGKDLYLRFRDALQVSATEIIVPSDDRRRIRLVKIQY